MCELPAVPVQVSPENVMTKGMDMGDVLKAESVEKVVTITNAGACCQLAWCYTLLASLISARTGVSTLRRQKHRSAVVAGQQQLYC